MPTTMPNLNVEPMHDSPTVSINDRNLYNDYNEHSDYNTGLVGGGGSGGGAPSLSDIASLAISPSGSIPTPNPIVPIVAGKPGANTVVNVGDEESNPYINYILENIAQAPTGGSDSMHVSNYNPTHNPAHVPTMGTYDPNAMEYQYESEPEYNQDDDADGVVEVEDDGHIEDWLSKHYYNSASAGTPYANPNTRSDVGNMNSNSNRYNNSNSNTGNVSKLSRYAHRQGVAYNNNSYNDSTSTGNGNNDSGQGSPQVNQIHRVVSKSESLKPSLSTSQSPSEVEGECSSGRDLNSNGNGAGSGTGNDNSYAKSKQWAMQREEKLNNERVQREKILELECSFKPNINGGGSGTANSNKTNKSIKSTIPTGVRMDNSNNSNTNSPGSNSSTSSIPHLHLYPAKLKPSLQILIILLLVVLIPIQMVSYLVLVLVLV